MADDALSVPEAVKRSAGATGAATTHLAPLNRDAGTKPAQARAAFGRASERAVSERCVRSARSRVRRGGGECGYRRRRQFIERQTQAWQRRYAAEGLRSGIAVIPVVVHVVWNAAVQNITHGQVQSQIDVLNDDFRALNADIGIVPPAFAGLVADARIEFQLARRDPNCGATTGITRTQTAVAAFPRPNNPVKSAATGGADPWPSDRYLNQPHLAGRLPPPNAGRLQSYLRDIHA